MIMLVVTPYTIQAHTQVVEKVGYILVGTECARTQARHLGESGGMIPREIVSDAILE